MKKYSLKERREKNGLTQKQVAEQLGVNKNYISMLENGTRNPSDKMKEKLSNIYSCSVADIFLSIQTTKCCTNKWGEIKWAEQKTYYIVNRQ